MTKQQKHTLEKIRLVADAGLERRALAGPEIALRSHDEATGIRRGWQMAITDLMEREGLSYWPAQRLARNRFPQLAELYNLALVYVETFREPL